MLFVCYPKCTTCQKARAFLEERAIPYEFRDIKPKRRSCGSGSTGAACP